MGMEQDNCGMHFGAFKNDILAGVVSLFHSKTIFQFRKLAVEPLQQNIGIGSSLLNYIINYAIENGGTKIWCNARLPAIGFYLKIGFTKTGDLFLKNGFDYEIMEKKLPGI